MEDHENMEIVEHTTKDRGNTKQFKDLFEKNAELNNQDLIKLYIKRIMAMAVSNLLYLRNIYPENNFEIMKFKDLKFKLLHAEKNDSAPYIKLLEDIFEFFESFSNGSSTNCILNVKWKDSMEKQFSEDYQINISNKDDLLELAIHTLNTTINTERLGINENQLINSIKLMLRNIQIIAQLRSPLPDGADADVDFSMLINNSIKEEETNLVEDVKTTTTPTFENLKMICALFNGKSDPENLDNTKPLKKLAVIAVSSILYVRQVFPKEAFMIIPLIEDEAPILQPFDCPQSDAINSVLEELLNFISILETNINHEIVVELYIGNYNEVHKIRFHNNNDSLSMSILMPDKIRYFQLKRDSPKEVIIRIKNWNAKWNQEIAKKQRFDQDSKIIVFVNNLENNIRQETEL